LLAVRVSSLLGESPMESLDEMEGALFGTGPNPLLVPSDSTLAAQFKAVSHNQLIYVPAEDPNLTRPGLLDITIEPSTMNEGDASSNRFDSVVRSALQKELERILGQSVSHVADRVLFCMPSGSLDLSVAGIGEVGGMFTFFHLGYCRKLDALMHELGHNLNFHHSGIGLQEYGDMTDYMGGLETPKSTKDKKWGLLKGKSQSVQVTIDGAGYPKKAFNGHKHWTAGWFQNRAMQVFPLQSNCSIHFRIVSFVEYGNEAMQLDDVVLLRVGSLYIQYNRAKGYNVDAPEANRVTVTEGFVDGGLSVRVASLTAGEHYKLPNFESSGKALFIQVCAITQKSYGELDFADVSVFLDDGIQNLSCSTREQVRSDVWRPGSIVLGVFQVEESVRMVVCLAILVTCVVFLTCACFLLCSIRCRYFYVDRKSGIDEAKSTDKNVQNNAVVRNGGMQNVTRLDL
jgi:Gametolysin peptidase M11